MAVVTRSGSDGILAPAGKRHVPRPGIPCSLGSADQQHCVGIGREDDGDRRPDEGIADRVLHPGRWRARRSRSRRSRGQWLWVWQPPPQQPPPGGGPSRLEIGRLAAGGGTRGQRHEPLELPALALGAGDLGLGPHELIELGVTGVAAIGVDGHGGRFAERVSPVKILSPGGPRTRPASCRTPVAGPAVSCCAGSHGWPAPKVWPAPSMESSRVVGQGARRAKRLGLEVRDRSRPRCRAR